MKIKPTLSLNVHTAEGRAFFQSHLSGYTQDEIQSILAVTAMADRGEHVEMSLDEADDGRYCLKFTIGKKQIVTESETKH